MLSRHVSDATSSRAAAHCQPLRDLRQPTPDLSSRSPPAHAYAAAQPDRPARPPAHQRCHLAPPRRGQGRERGQGPPAARGQRRGGGEEEDGRGVEEARLVLGGGRGRGAAAAPAARALRVRAPPLHGRRVHHPHGPARRAAARPRLHCDQGDVRRGCRAPVAQLAPRRAQHGLRRDAGGLHPVGDPRRGPAPRRRRRAHDVHLPGRARLRHAAAAAPRVPGLRDGLPRRQRLLLPLLLGPRRRRGDRGRRHAARGADRARAALRRAQRAAGGQAARLQGPLHHRPGRWRRRGGPLRHALGMVLRRQECYRRRLCAGEALPQLPVPQGCSFLLICVRRPQVPTINGQLSINSCQIFLKILTGPF